MTEALDEAVHYTSRDKGVLSKYLCRSTVFVINLNSTVSPMAEQRAFTSGSSTGSAMRVRRPRTAGRCTKTRQEGPGESRPTSSFSPEQIERVGDLAAQIVGLKIGDSRSPFSHAI